AVEHAREDVASELIGAERVALRGRVEDLLDVWSVRVPRRDQWRQDGQRGQADHDHSAEQCELVSSQRTPECPHALTGGPGGRTRVFADPPGRTWGRRAGSRPAGAAPR